MFLGGDVTLDDDEMFQKGARRIFDARDLPKESFRLTGVSVMLPLPIREPRTLAYFRGCKRVVYVAFNTVPMTDEDLVPFAQNKNLRHLRMVIVTLGDESMEGFARCEKLEQSFLDETKVSEKTLAPWKDRRKDRHAKPPKTPMPWGQRPVG